MLSDVRPKVYAEVPQTLPRNTLSIVVIGGSQYLYAGNDDNLPVLVSGPFPNLSDTPKWNGVKSASNPIISGTSGLSNQAYPPGSLYDPVSGKFYIIVKSDGDLYLFRSNDGKTEWTEVKKVLSKGTSGQWDEGKLEYSVFRYDSRTGTYHILYTARDSSTTWAIGHATSSTVEGDYTKQGMIYDGSDTSSTLGISLNYFELGDLKRVNGEFIFYLVGGQDEGGRLQNRLIFCATGTDFDDINARNIIFTYQDVNHLREEEVTVLQDCSVFKWKGAIYMLFTAGIDGDVLARKHVYAAKGDLYNFEVLTDVVIDNTGEDGTWEEREVYNPEVLLKSDDEYLEPLMVGDSYLVYYAGHDLSNETGNKGLTGLIEFDSFPMPYALSSERVKKQDFHVENLGDDEFETVFLDRKNFSVWVITSRVNRPETAMFTLNTDDDRQRIQIVSQSPGNVFEVSEQTEPTGTTGTDGKTTIHASPTSGKLEIENREGGSRSYDFVQIQSYPL